MHYPLGILRQGIECVLTRTVRLSRNLSIFLQRLFTWNKTKYQQKKIVTPRITRKLQQLPSWIMFKRKEVVEKWSGLIHFQLFLSEEKKTRFWSHAGSGVQTSSSIMQGPSSSYSSSLSSPSSVSPGHPGHAPPPLPPGWQECVSKSTGRTYFWNQHTKKSQWDRPTKSAIPHQLSPVEVSGAGNDSCCWWSLLTKTLKSLNYVCSHFLWYRSEFIQF